MAATIPVGSRPALDPEDAARANWYALIARLFYGPPDASLLGQIAGIDVPPDPAGAPNLFATALRDLAVAAGRATAAGAREEYDDLFIGTGKARVTLYLSHYLVATGREKLLVRLRDDLAGLGLARKSEALEPEDHLSGICEVMRHLITTGGAASFQDQRGLYDRWLARSFAPVADAVAASAPRAGIYRAAGAFARAFFAVEAEAFAIGD